MRWIAPVLLAPLLAAEQPPTNTLIFGGDVMLARYIYLQAQAHKDPTYAFRPFAELFRAADIAFANLESPFAATGPFFENRMVFRAKPDMIEGLKFAGIDVVSTANNHVRDAGPQGIQFTIDLLAKHGIEAVGTTGKPAVLERKGVKFGFLAYTFDQRNGNYLTDDSRVSMMEPATIARDVQELSKQASVVIVSMHAGYEYHTRPNPQQIRFARTAIDAGAAVVVGHHPHVVQPMEAYKTGVIFYSLGNLVFDQRPKPGVRQSAIAEAVFTGAKLTSYRLQ